VCGCTSQLLSLNLRQYFQIPFKYKKLTFWLLSSIWQVLAGYLWDVWLSKEDNLKLVEFQIILVIVAFVYSIRIFNHHGSYHQVYSDAARHLFLDSSKRSSKWKSCKYRHFRISRNLSLWMTICSCAWILYSWSTLVFKYFRLLSLINLFKGSPLSERLIYF